MNWNVKCFSMLNISQVILMITDSNMCGKQLTVHWSAPNSLIRSYLQPCTNSMWGDESEAVAPIIWLYQIVDARKEEVFFPELLITLRSYDGCTHTCQLRSRWLQLRLVSQTFIFIHRYHSHIRAWVYFKFHSRTANIQGYPPGGSWVGDCLKPIRAVGNFSHIKQFSIIVVDWILWLLLSQFFNIYFSLATRCKMV